MQSAQGIGDLQYILKVAEKNFSADNKEIDIEELKGYYGGEEFNEEIFRVIKRDKKNGEGNFAKEVRDQLEKCITGDINQDEQNY